MHTQEQSILQQSFNVNTWLYTQYSNEGHIVLEYTHSHEGQLLVQQSAATSPFLRCECKSLGRFDHSSRF